MAFNETGHYKNVAHFDLLVGYVISFGANYQPTKEVMALASLQSLYQSANTKLTGVQGAKNNYSQKVGERAAIFKGTKRFATRTVANLSGTNVSRQTIANAKTINDKIQGIRATTPSISNPGNVNPTATTHSVSRQSHDMLYDNFRDLVSVLAIADGYDTSHDEFTIPKLTLYSDTLKLSNQNVNNAVVQVTKSRLERDNILYAPEIGLVDIALQVKEYIKGLYGASSPEYKIINRIKFKNITY